MSLALLSMSTEYSPSSCYSSTTSGSASISPSSSTPASPSLFTYSQNPIASNSIMPSRPPTPTLITPVINKNQEFISFPSEYLLTIGVPIAIVILIIGMCFYNVYREKRRLKKLVSRHLRSGPIPGNVTAYVNPSQVNIPHMV